jgi:hypothetical protein
MDAASPRKATIEESKIQTIRNPGRPGYREKVLRVDG